MKGAAALCPGLMTGAAQFTRPVVVKISGADLVEVAKSGKKKMPGFEEKLAEDHIHAVVAYVQHTPTSCSGRK